MDVFLVRHAKAGSRSRQGDGDDRERPLSGKGRRQAQALAEALVSRPIGRVLSSPYLRCVQTVEPLAGARAVELEVTAALAEGAGCERALALAEAATVATVLCTHGDVIGDLMIRLERRGVALHGDGLEKASTWVLTVNKGEVVEARYVPPPAR